MKTRYKIILGILTCTSIIIFWLSNITEGEYYRNYSPDGQYSIYASRNKYFNLNIPFVKFGDAGGKVHLYDELENKLVCSASIGMISNVDDHFFWNEQEVYSKGNIYIKLPRKINIKIIDEYYKSFPLKYPSNLFIEGKQFIVNKKSNRLTVSNESGEILLQDIRYISRIDNGFQVLNDNTEIEYYDAELNKLKKISDVKIEYNEVCGNVTTYGLKIEETKKYYIIKKAIGFTNYNFRNYIAIDSVNKTKVKDIYFLNKKRELFYNDNTLRKEHVVIDFGTYFGILSNKYGIEYFDSINNLNKTPIKVMRNNLYGYYNITPPRFTNISPFEFNLAEFKNNEKGYIKKGYIDRNGNTYYNYH